MKNTHTQGTNPHASETNEKRFCRTNIAFIVSSFLFGIPIVAHAQWVDLKNFFYRDFLDLGQNRGQFQPGTTNLTIESIKNPGVSVNFPFEIPNFSARSEHGNMTAIGRGYAATAWHVVTIDKNFCQNNKNFCTWGQTQYNESSYSVGQYGKDSRFVRMDKFIVEGSANLLDGTGITGTTALGSSLEDWNKQQENKNKLLERIKKMQDSNGNVYLIQAGQGKLKVTGEQASDGTGIFSNDGEGLGSLWGMKGGTYGTIWRDNNYNELFVVYEKITSYNQYRDAGLAIRYDGNRDFLNNITGGDSGSGFYAYDAQKKQWYLIGVTSETNDRYVSRISYLAESDFDDYKSRFEQTINLQNDSWTLNNNNLSEGDPSLNQTLQENKDIILQGGGTINVESDVILNKTQTNGSTQKLISGGLVFMAKDGASEANPTQYTITQGNGNHKFDGAGVDVGENVKVTWNLGLGSALHKVGAGTLEITTASTPTDNKYQVLRLGEGKVILNTDRKVFSSAYITSGRATLELVKGKGEALGATKDNGNNSYKLEQSKNDNMGFTFGNSGGGILT